MKASPLLYSIDVWPFRPLLKAAMVHESMYRTVRIKQGYALKNWVEG